MRHLPAPRDAPAPPEVPLEALGLDGPADLAEVLEAVERAHLGVARQRDVAADAREAEERREGREGDVRDDESSADAREGVETPAGERLQSREVRERDVALDDA